MAFVTVGNGMLNDQEVYNLYVELGSFRKVAIFLRSNGQINPSTGKRFTDMGIWHAVYRYGLAHMDELREEFRKQGSNPDTRLWEERMVMTALIVYKTSKTRFLSWASENGFMQYNHLFSHLLPDELPLRSLEELV